MLTYIEPCCLEKQLTAVLSEIENQDNVVHLFSNSDWTVSHLLNYLAGRMHGCTITLVLPRIEPKTLETLRSLMLSKPIDPYTKEHAYLVDHLSLITRGDDRDEVLAHLSGFGSRVSVCEDLCDFRCLAIATANRHIVVQGSLNQRLLQSTQMFTITTGRKLYHQAMACVGSKARVKAIPDWEEAYQRLTAHNS